MFDGPPCGNNFFNVDGKSKLHSPVNHKHYLEQVLLLGSDELFVSIDIAKKKVQNGEKENLRANVF